MIEDLKNLFSFAFVMAENMVSLSKGEYDEKYVINIDAKKVLTVSCGDGFVKILSLQMQGKKRMTVEEFLRGAPVNDWKLIN